jgi:hypothetical protein
MILTELDRILLKQYAALKVGYGEHVPPFATLPPLDFRTKYERMRAETKAIVRELSQEISQVQEIHMRPTIIIPDYVPEDSSEPGVMPAASAFTINVTKPVSKFLSRW